MWKKLTFDDLKRYLSQDELEKLNEISIDEEVETVVQDQLDIISDAWRGCLSGAGYELDPREHYTPSEYTHWILTYARYAIWTRFPNSPAYALDDARKAEYEKSIEIMNNPKANTSAVDWSSPDLSSYSKPSKTGSVWVPMHHIWDDLPTITDFEPWTTSIKIVK